MRKILGLILPILFIFSLAVGCTSKEITRQDIIGKYVANYDKDKVTIDSIEVRADGTYIHYFKPAKDGNSFTNIGTWTFEYENGEPRLNFRNFTIGYQEPEGLVSKTGYIWSPEVQNDGDRLLIDEDYDLHYDKQK
jgi:hypothetical protein